MHKPSFTIFFLLLTVKLSGMEQKDFEKPVVVYDLRDVVCKRCFPVLDKTLKILGITKPKKAQTHF